MALYERHSGWNNSQRQQWLGFSCIVSINDHWLLVTESNMDGNYCGTHLQQHCENGIYKITFPTAGEANGLVDIYPAAAIPFATPWRVIITGKN